MPFVTFDKAWATEPREGLQGAARVLLHARPSAAASSSSPTTTGTSAHRHTDADLEKAIRAIDREPSEALTDEDIPSRQRGAGA
ncbi:MAG: hypothetical protein MZV70_22050 [Desulfobacterales bacterium]|nr:hypothetical protein [Desulfobacterales bacterium]